MFYTLDYWNFFNSPVMSTVASSQKLKYTTLDSQSIPNWTGRKQNEMDQAQVCNYLRLLDWNLKMASLETTALLAENYTDGFYLWQCTLRNRFTVNPPIIDTSVIDNSIGIPFGSSPLSKENDGYLHNLLTNSKSQHASVHDDWQWAVDGINCHLPSTWCNMHQLLTANRHEHESKMMTRTFLLLFGHYDILSELVIERPKLEHLNQLLQALESTSDVCDFLVYVVWTLECLHHRESNNEKVKI